MGMDAGNFHHYHHQVKYIQGAYHYCLSSALDKLLGYIPCVAIQSHSQNDSGDLRGVAGGDGELGCLCGKAGTSRLCDGSAHSSGCVVNGSIGCLLSYYYH